LSLSKYQKSSLKEKVAYVYLSWGDRDDRWLLKDKKRFGEDDAEIVQAVFQAPGGAKAG
jgi:hypothetical protein